MYPCNSANARRQAGPIAFMGVNEKTTRTAIPRLVSDRPRGGVLRSFDALDRSPRLLTHENRAFSRRLTFDDVFKDRQGVLRRWTYFSQSSDRLQRRSAEAVRPIEKVELFVFCLVFKRQ